MNEQPQKEAAVTESKEMAHVPGKPLSRGEIIIGSQSDVSHLSLSERIELFQRLSEAQASPIIDDRLLNKDLVIVGMTVYDRDFVNQETAAVELANYVSFELESGEVFRTSSSQAIPFAMQTARLIGYDARTGKLPIKMVIQVVPQRAETGFIYRFIFKGEAKK